MSGGAERYIALRMPVWLSIQDDRGVKWWGPGSDADDDYAGDKAALDVALARQGKPRTQVREWRFNALTSYNFAGIGGDARWLRNLTVGGSVRWEDRGSIGFYGAPPGPDGVIRRLDGNRPIWDASRFYFDGFARYQLLRLFKNKVRASVQLNVRNIFEDGGLRVVGANPDGSPFAFRIIDPRHIMLTTTFDL